MSLVNPIFPVCYVLNPEELSDSSKILNSLRHQIKIETFRHTFKGTNIPYSVPFRFIRKIHKEKKTYCIPMRIS